METNIKPWVWQTTGFLVIAFLALTVMDKIHTVSNDFKPELPKNTISMSAEGKVSAVPDLATVNLGVVTSAATAKQAQSDNATKANKVIDYVKSQGIDKKDIATTQLNVYPEYDYSNGQNTVKGYQASQTISVKVRGVDKSTDALGKIIDGATNAGANQIQGVNLDFADADNFKQSARKQAIDKAKQKAQELADQAGLKLGRIVSISEGSSSYPMPMPYAMDSKLGMGGGGSAPNIETGSQDITASITVTFEVK